MENKTFTRNFSSIADVIKDLAYAPYRSIDELTEFIDDSDRFGSEIKELLIGLSNGMKVERKNSVQKNAFNPLGVQIIECYSINTSVIIVYFEENGMIKCDNLCSLNIVPF